MGNKQKSEIVDRFIVSIAEELDDRKNMSDTQFDVIGWSNWIIDHQAIGSKLLGASRSNMEAYFLIAHAATEAMFRRILFVGLRLNKVTYAEANDWLFHNDVTPDGIKYPDLFNRLYQSKQVAWSGIVTSDPELSQLWDSWLGYSKVIRNHISHGVRKYKDDWLQCGITIDQELILRLDQALSKIIGGSVCADLRKINPRLPIGVKGSDFKKITNFKRNNKPRPTVSLDSAKNVIARLTPR